MNLPQLPIDSHLAHIAALIADHNCLILEAPPGTGKTTRVAASLLAVPVITGKIALIQPRRIAARAAAARIAFERSSRIGDLIGYQVRFDSQCTAQTRLISMTPGILLRRLQADPLLENFSAIVLDEFHERSAEIDLLLGMVRQVQQELRPELKIVIMSATLECGQIAEYLNQPPLLKIAATNYPVDIRYSRFESPTQRLSPFRRIVDTTATAVEKAMAEQSGDILVFLPGVGEIMQVRKQVEAATRRHDCELHTLYGDMNAQDQDRVLTPAQRRRVILATNVAETSLTIDGVRVVVDSGWARVKRFDPSVGLDELRLEPISQASATQRAGRAGRTQPGVCYRLWDEVTARSRAAQLEPEVKRVDLAHAVLLLLSWGQRPEEFSWLTPPHPTAIEAAREVLSIIGAIDHDRLTALGQQLLKFPVHPRLARLLVAAHALGIPSAGAMAAALQSERDLFMRPQAEALRRTRGETIPPTQYARKWSCDITHKVSLWNKYLQDGQPETELGTINMSAARNLTRTADQFLRIAQAELGQKSDQPLADQLQRALLTAFPDRLAKRRSATGLRAVMVGGRGVQLEPSSGVSSELFLCLDVDAGTADASVRAASAVELQWLSEEMLPPELLHENDERFFNPTQQSVVTRRRLYWIDLLLNESTLPTPLDQATAAQLSVEAAKQFERLIPAKDKELHSLLGRIRWLSAAMPELMLPTLHGAQLAHALEDWCLGKRSIDELKQLPWSVVVQGLLSNEQRRLLDQHAPQAMSLPTGRQVLLHYEQGQPPVLAARIQEFFGWKSTPVLAGGRVPLLLHLLAPNQRCHQITADLASFWKNTYPSVRKELRGRYPKHDWPEDPVGKS